MATKKMDALAVLGKQLQTDGGDLMRQSAGIRGKADGQYKRALRAGEGDGCVMAARHFKAERPLLR